MFRLIHSSRMPVKQTESPESLIEGYHQDSLDSGSRIREGLSEAVERSIISISNGFLSHPDNHELVIRGCEYTHAFAFSHPSLPI